MEPIHSPGRRRRWPRVLFLVVLPLLSLGVVAAAVIRGPATDDDAAPAGPPPALHNGQSFIQDNLWSTATEQYAVWVAPDRVPYVGKRARPDGEWQAVSLAAVMGNPLAAPVAEDLHNVFAVAVDSLGYVHVAGNMHDHPLRYVRSQRPGDITAWAPAQVAGPATRVAYPSFVALPDGTLQFWRREGMSGDGAVVMDALAPGEEQWRSLGVILDGRPSAESPYLHHVAVDPGSGTIHLMFEWRGTGEASTNHDVGYARSRDGGGTWETSDGRRIPSPITHDNAEIVLDTAATGSGLVNGGGLTVDDEGRPHGIVVVEAPGTPRRLVHLWHDGDEWQESELDGATVLGRPAIAGLRDGSVWLLGVADGRLRAVDVSEGDRGRDVTLAHVPPGWEPTFDSQALALDGTVETLVPVGADPRVVVALGAG